MMAGRMGPAADRDLVLRRYDRVERRGQPALTLAWANNLAGAAGVLDVGNAVLIDAQGAVLVGGALQQSTEEMDRHLEAFDLKSGARLDPPCVDDGNPSEVFIADERINDLALAPDGHIAAVGFQTKTEGQGKDAWVGYYLPSGCELAWNRTVSGDNRGDDEAVGVAVDDAGDLVTVGFLFGSDSEDLWVAKWDASGDVRWQAMLVNGPGNGDDQARAVSIGADGEINVAGFLSRAGEAGLSDIWVGRFTP
jgi:hypothetical protein